MTNPIAHIRAAAESIWATSSVPPTLDELIAVVLRATADHLGSCNASTELLAIAAELEASPA